MGDRQARAQHRPMTAIKQKEPAGGIVIQGARQMPPDPLGGRQAAEAFAFQMQESNFIERIERPQSWGEFQAVDDCDGLAQPNVLGAQVAMCIDEPPPVNPLKQQGGAFYGKPALNLCDPLHSALRKAEAGVEQYAAIGSQRVLPCDKIVLGFKRDARRVRVKRGERCGEPINLRGLQPASAQGRFKRLVLLKPAHDHQPIHDRPVAGDRET